MMQFDHKTHTYGFPGDTRKWTSATSMVALFHDKFDSVAVSEQVSRNPKSKWYGMAPEVIRQHWEAKAQASRDLGHWYHGVKEREILSQPTIKMRGQDLPTFGPIVDADGVWAARDQRLEEGVYVEHLMYYEPELICGIEDVVVVSREYIDMFDHKTSQSIEMTSYKDKRMYYPINALPDSSFWHHSFQMNLYMFMALEHNPGKKMGDMTLRHVTFEETEGPLGERIFNLDANGDPIVKNVTSLRVPDLQQEVRRALQSKKHLQ